MSQFMKKIAFAENPALIVILFAGQSYATERSKKKKTGVE